MTSEHGKSEVFYHKFQKMLLAVRTRERGLVGASHAALPLRDGGTIWPTWPHERSSGLALTVTSPERVWLDQVLFSYDATT